MSKINYADMAKHLLGDEIYMKFIKEIAKEDKNKSNIIDYAKEVIEESCLLIIMLGISNRVELDDIKICLGGSEINISSKEFAKKYREYVKQISDNVLK